MAFSAEVAELIVALRLDDKGFSAKLNNAARQLKGMDAGLAQMSRGAGQVGRGVDKIITRGAIAAAAGLAGVITTAASFEQAWAGVTKTVEGANEELLDDFKQLSREIPLSFEELAAIGAEGGALGIATKDLIDFTDIVARLAVSTDLTAEAASSSLGKLANVLHLQDDELRDFGDSLVALGNDGASTESEILGLAERFGAAGKLAGLSNEAILALASTTASMGIEAEAGGGALSRIFNNITLDIGTATKESQVLADAMNMSLGELKTAWDQDAGAVFGDLLGYINELDKFEQAEFLSNLGITNTRDINAISLLAAGVEEYGRQLEVSEGQTNELNKESDAFFNTTEGRWEILKNNVRLAADTIGSKLLPIVNELGEEFVTWLSDPKVQKGLEDFATGLAEGVRGLITDLKNADFGPLLDTLKGAGAIAKAGFDAFRALPPGIQSLALAAFGINKLTGGALTDIAKGFGNIFAGGLKLLFERGSPTNPMFVVPIGGGLGGGLGGTPGVPAPAGGVRGLLGNAWKLLPPLAVAAIAAEFSDEIAGFGVGLRADLAKTLDLDLPTFGPSDWDWPFGTKNTPTILPGALFGPNGIFGGTPSPTPPRVPGTASFSAPGVIDATYQAEDRRPNAYSTRTYQAEDRRPTAVLPDTAMAPIVTAVNGLGTRLAPLSPTLSRVQQEARSADQVLMATGGRTASASERTAAKNFSPTIRNDISVPVTVSVSATVLANQLYRTTVARTYSSSTSTNTGGI